MTRELIDVYKAFLKYQRQDKIAIASYYYLAYMRTIYKTGE